MEQFMREPIICPSYRIRMHAEAMTSKYTMPTVVTEISAECINIQSASVIPPKTRVVISLRLDKKIVLRGNVVWVLDTQSEEGEQYYQAGIKTDVILHPDIKAIGLAERSKLLQEILYQIMERSEN